MAVLSAAGCGKGGPAQVLALRSVEALKSMNTEAMGIEAERCKEWF